MLSIGLHGANNTVNQWNANQKKENTTSLAHIIYRECAKGLDGFYFAPYKRIVEAAQAEGIDLTELMNEAISAAYSLPDSIDYAGEMIYDDETKYYAFIPFLETISGIQINDMGSLEMDNATINGLSEDPLMGYLHLEDGYPMPGVEVDEDMYVEQIQIERSEALQKIAVITVIQGPTLVDCAHYRNANCGGTNTNDTYIHLKLCSASNPKCEFCGDNPYDGALIPQDNTFGVFPGPARHDEIYIWLDYDLDDKTTHNLTTPECFNKANDIMVEKCLTDNIPVPIIDRYYALLEKVDGSGYFLVDKGNISKVDRPIEWHPKNAQECNGSEISVNDLFLCQRETIFKSLAEHRAFSGGPNDNPYHFGLAQGGIYKLRRSFGLPPLYFAFPWNKSFWYIDGPDMRVFANMSYDQSCDDYDNNGNVIKSGIRPDYNNYSLNKFTDFSNSTFNKNKNIVITTDYYDEMYDFWVNVPGFWISFGPIGQGNAGHSASDGFRKQIDLEDISGPPVDPSTLNILGTVDSDSYLDAIEEQLFMDNIDPNTSFINLLVELEYSWNDGYNTVTTHYEEVSFDTSQSVGGPEISLFFTTRYWDGHNVTVYAL